MIDIRTLDLYCEHSCGPAAPEEFEEFQVHISARPTRLFVPAGAVCLCATAVTRVQAAPDPLPSCNRGAVKTRIVSFVDDKEGRPIGIYQAIGKLERGLDAAGARGWSLISVENDWKTVYTPQK
jgi:hypothetical protein